MLEFFLKYFCHCNAALGLFGLHCNRVLPFFCFHSHKDPNSLCCETNEPPASPSPAPQNSVEAIRWATGGQSSSCCRCRLCQLNTVTFDLSFYPLCLSSVRHVEHCDLPPKKSLVPLWLDPNCAKKKKNNTRGKIFYKQINSQPFTVKKKSSLYVELWFNFGWECNKELTRFPVETKKLEAKVSGGRCEAVVEILKILSGI